MKKNFLKLCLFVVFVATLPFLSSCTSKDPKQMDDDAVAFLEMVFPNATECPYTCNSEEITTERFREYVSYAQDADPLYYMMGGYAQITPNPQFSKYEGVENAYKVVWTPMEGVTLDNVVVLVKEDGKYLIDNIVMTDPESEGSLLFDYSMTPSQIFGDFDIEDDYSEEEED